MVERERTLSFAFPSQELLTKLVTELLSEELQHLPPAREVVE